MEFYLKVAALCIVAYLLGSISFSIIITERLIHKDIRDFGSGNAGGTNVIRVLGAKKGILVMVLDMLKGLVAVLLARLILGSAGDLYLAIIAFFAVMGHLFPVFYGFKGGKGIAVTAGILLGITPLTMLSLLVMWGIIVAITKYVSLGSVAAGFMTPVFYFLYTHFLFKVPFETVIWPTAVFAAIGTATIISHRANIVRLIKGTESKIGSKKDK